MTERPERMDESKEQPEETPAETTGGKLATDGGISEDGIVAGGDARLRDKVIAAMQSCYDPEIPIDIYQLGLIYAVAITDTGHAAIQMTLTSPNCPVAGTLPGEVEQLVAAVAEITTSTVELVWDPPWGPDKMTEAARLQLGLF
jgi:FeS assembly SUF system protein